MSITPKNLPKRTRVLSKDFLFQEKHALTDTQIDIMSYIFNAFTWAMKVDGYIILTTKKFGSDLPQIGQKTLDASLLELKNKGLIKTKLIKIASWGNVRVRGVEITVDGMEYNSSLYAPTHEAIMAVYQDRIDELMEKINILEKDSILESGDLAPKNKAVEKIEDEEDKAVISKGEDEAKTVISEGKDEAKAVISKSIDKPEIKLESLEDFVKRVRNRFILTSEAICNMVDGFPKDSTFYINSYGKLSISNPNMECFQITNPIQINKFWRWLSINQHRIGNIIDLNDPQILLKSLQNQYRGIKINIANKERWINDIILIKNSFAVKIKDKNGTIFIISDFNKKPKLYDYDACKNYIDGLKDIVV